MEVLSPVKNLESAIIAINSGADAIYFSSDVFGARNNAKNSHEEVREIVEYAKLHYTKTYVTLNTLIFNDELELFFNEINFLHMLGVDAIILQDYAMINIVKSMFDDIDIHCSTQMNIGNSYAAKFVKDLGANRVVVPREVPIKNIMKIGDIGIETEVFVHGALCTSYSGLCLISSLESNMSGNRGKCSQFCRMDTIMYKNGLEYDSDDYMLSFKDLNASNSISDLQDIKVTSIKIEGRLKQSEYVALTTYTYRNLVDKNQINNELDKVYNREFTAGYLNESSSKDINNSTRINNNGYYVGKVVKQDDKWIYIESKTELVHLDKIRFIQDDYETGQTVDVVENLSDNLYRVKSRIDDLVGSDVYVVYSKQINKNVADKVYNGYKNKIYNIIVNMEVGKHIEVTFNNKIYLSNSILEQAEKRPVEEKQIIKQLSKTKDYGFDFDITLNYAPGFIRISELNEIRRNIYEDIKNELLNVEHVDKTYDYEIVKAELDTKKFYIEVSNEQHLESLKNFDKDFIVVISDDELLNKAKKLGYVVYKVFPAVMEEENLEHYQNLDEYDGVVVSELGAFEALKDYQLPIISNFTLNTTNVINQQMLLNLCNKTILSLECSYNDLESYNLSKSIGFLYGYTNAMNMKYCPINKTKGNSCGDCSLCIDNDYKINIKGNDYMLMKQNYDKLALLFHSPIYNKSLLEFNMDYYIRFTKEEKIDKILDDILNDDVDFYIDTYLEETK